MSDIIGLVNSVTILVGFLAAVIWGVVFWLKQRALQERITDLELALTHPLGDGLWWHIRHLRKAVFGRPANDSDPSRIDELVDRVKRLEEESD
jgi:hypothetical protein